MKTNDGSGTEMMVRILAGLAAVLYSLRSLQAAGNAFGYLLRLFTAYYKISNVLYLMGSILALLSCLAMSLALALFAWRRTKENTENMFLMVGMAGIVRIGAVFLKMILTYMARMARGSYFSFSPFITFIKEVIYVAIAVGALFAVLYASGDMIYVRKSKDELTDMLKGLPDIIRTEISNAQRQPKEMTEPKEVRTGRNYFYILFIGLITGGLYLYYVYYTMAKDLDIICDGDGRSTIGIIPHILLNIATLGFFEFYWQYSVADRMSRISKRYRIDIKETGKSILICMIVGMFVFFLGTYVAMYFQIRNLNKLSEAYNVGISGES